MIHLLGVDSDNTFLHTIQRMHHLAPGEFQVVNLRALIERGSWKIDVGGECEFIVDNELSRICPGDSIYLRMIDISEGLMDSSVRSRSANVFTGLTLYFQNHKGRVINRPMAGAHNGSKSLHEYLIRKRGFKVPASITSCDKSEILRFCDGGLAVVKALSGIRASCRTVNRSTFKKEKFDGPVYLQRQIKGPDVRVHVVGKQCFPLQIDCPEVDYRDHLGMSVFSDVGLSDELKNRLISATDSFDLVFAGWDFKVDSQGEFWCLEANPMPGYSGYDTKLHGRISAAILDVLRRGL